MMKLAVLETHRWYYWGTVINGLLELLNSPNIERLIGNKRIFFCGLMSVSYHKRMRIITQSRKTSFAQAQRVALFCQLIRILKPYMKLLKNMKRGSQCPKRHVKIYLDLALLDLGEDGHTAGLFAGSFPALRANAMQWPLEDGKVWETYFYDISFPQQNRCCLVYVIRKVSELH